MENNNNVSKKNSVSSISQTPNPNMIKRYPFNGRSKYLIDRFYIIGFKPNQINKIIFKNEQNKKLLQSMAKKVLQEESTGTFNSKSQFNPNFQKNPPKKLTIEESPSLLNEISSDMKKELPDINLIKNMLFPNKINFYIKSELLRKDQYLSRYTSNQSFSFQKKILHL